MTDLNKALEDLSTRERNTNIMIEDITEMTDKQKKLDSELSLYKAKCAKLNQEVKCKITIIEDKRGELNKTKDLLLIWQTLVNEKTHGIHQQQRQLEDVHKSISDLREKFCESVNDFVDKNDLLIGESNQMLLSAVQKNKAAGGKKIENENLEKEIMKLREEIKTAKKHYSYQISSLKSEKEKLDAEAASLVENLKKIETPLKKNLSQNSAKENVSHFPTSSQQSITFNFSVAELYRPNDNGYNDDNLPLGEVKKSTSSRKQSRKSSLEECHIITSLDQSQVSVKKFKGIISSGDYHSRKMIKQANITQYFKKD